MRVFHIYIISYLLLIPITTLGNNCLLSIPKDTIKKDTIIKAPPRLLKTQVDSTKQADPILDYINQQRSKSKFNDWIGGLIINDRDTIKHKENINYEKEYRRLNNKTISAIHYIRLDPFGTSIDDTSRQASRWIDKTGNNLRFPTSRRIICKNLTIKEGMRVDPKNLLESERVLRQLNFIGDARIEVKLNQTDTTKVDVIVITRDRFPHAFSLDGNITDPELTLYSRNLTGNGIGFAHTSAYDKGKHTGNKEELSINNIEKSRINIEATYSNMVDNRFYSFSARRSFYISQLKYAGGIMFNRANKTLYHPAASQAIWKQPLSYRYSNAWLGRSFNVQTNNYFDDSNIYLISMYVHSKFHNLTDSLLNYPVLLNNNYYFGSITFSKRHYYRNNKIYNFNRTEDVPLGFMSTLTFGINDSPVNKRKYLRAHFSFGKALSPKHGYLYGKIEAGSYFNLGKSEQGELILKGKYISPLLHAGLSRFRSFIELKYIKGFNRYPNEYLRLTEKQGGVTSYTNKELTGKERLTLKTENVFFTPHRITGFNVMMLTFADLGIIGDGRSNLFHQHYQASIGGAIRLINNKLVFRIIEIRLAWLPLLPNDELPFNLRIRGETNPRFDDFIPDAPIQDSFR